MPEEVINVDRKSRKSLKWVTSTCTRKKNQREVVAFSFNYQPSFVQFSLNEWKFSLSLVSQMETWIESNVLSRGSSTPVLWVPVLLLPLRTPSFKPLVANGKAQPPSSRSALRVLHASIQTLPESGVGPHCPKRWPLSIWQNARSGQKKKKMERQLVCGYWLTSC